MVAKTFSSFLVVSLGTVSAQDVPLKDMFAKFKSQHNRVYESEEDEQYRLSIFKENVATAVQLNKEHGYDCTDMFGSCGFGVTKFSDMSKEEFKSKMLGYKQGNRTRPMNPLPPSAYAKGFGVSKKDWRQEGKTTPIKDQNPCGVCWAFSAASTVESAYAIATGGSPPLLSPQEIVECDGHHSCDGSDSGGNYEQAWQYLESHGGLASRSAYPTTCCDETSHPVIGQCKSVDADVKVTGIYDGPHDEQALAAAVASRGPFSIAVAADSWQHWQPGALVMTGGCAGNVDHAVSIVGFDTTARDRSGNPLPYWIVRNQWGTDWGYNGYILIKMGLDLCKITTEPAIAEVATSQKDIVV